MRFTRLLTTILIFILTAASAFAQFETEAGKIVVKNGFWPYPAGNSKVGFVRLDMKIPGNPVELYLGDLTNGKETRLLPGENFSDHPTYAFAFSPDGSEFIVPIKRPESWQLFRYKVGNREGTQIGDLSQFLEVPTKDVTIGMGLEPSTLVEISDMSWSPSGNKIAFTMARPGKTATWWMDLTTGRTRQATEDKTGYWAALHPNDELMCYTDNIMREDKSTSEGIILRSITTGDMDTLCNEDDNEFAGSISPDGKYMAYNRRLDNTNNIWVMNLETKEIKALTHSSNQKHCAYPRWSPDGKRLYFQGNGFLAEPVVFEREFTPF